MTRLIFGLLICSSFSAYAYRNPYIPKAQVMGEEAFGFEVEGRHFETTGYYDYYQKFIGLNSNQSYSQTDTSALLRYGFNGLFEINGGGRTRQVHSRNTLQDQSRFDFESFHFGAKYSFPRQSKRTVWTLYGDVNFTTFNHPTYEDGNIDQPISLGDKGTTYEAGLAFSWSPNGSWYFGLEAGFRQPQGRQSQELPYSGEIAYRWSGAALVIGMEGIYSLENGLYSGSPLDKPPVDLASTNLYNAVDREWMKPFGKLQIRLASQWVLGMTYKRVVYGRDTDQGNEYLLRLSFWTEGKNRDRAKVSSFKEYDVEASVIKISPRGSFIKIDKGVSDDIEKGMKFDIYEFDYLGGNVLVAEGRAYEVSAETTIIKINKRYRRIPVKIGFVARGKSI